jgi:tetratricopeptide (TPR) repeat protein
MDDRQLRIWFQVIFSMAVITIFCFTSHTSVLIVGLLLAITLGYTFPPMINSISAAFNSLIYGLDYSDDSYEGQFYQDDMDKAKRWVREEKWDKAIYAYREIIQKSPKMCEPRFYLAQVYQIAGHLGLALNEYKKIADLKDEFGSNHPFVLESERAVGELTKRLSVKAPGIEENDRIASGV